MHHAEPAGQQRGPHRDRAGHHAGQDRAEGLATPGDHPGHDVDASLQVIRRDLLAVDDPGQDDGLAGRVEPEVERHRDEHLRGQGEGDDQDQLGGQADQRDGQDRVPPHDRGQADARHQRADGAGGIKGADQRAGAGQPELAVRVHDHEPENRAQGEAVAEAEERERANRGLVPEEAEPLHDALAQPGGGDGQAGLRNGKWPPDRKEQQRGNDVAGRVNGHRGRGPDGRGQHSAQRRGGDHQYRGTRAQPGIGDGDPVAAGDRGQGAEVGGVEPDEHGGGTRGDDVDLRDAEHARRGGQRDAADQQGADQLAPPHQAAAVDPVRHRARHQADREVGDRLDRDQQRGLPGGPGALVDQDGQHHAGDQGAGQADAAGRPELAEGPVAAQRGGGRAAGVAMRHLRGHRQHSGQGCNLHVIASILQPMAG